MCNAEKTLNRVRILRHLLHPLNVVDAMELMRDEIGKTDTNGEKR